MAPRKPGLGLDHISVGKRFLYGHLCVRFLYIIFPLDLPLSIPEPALLP